MVRLLICHPSDPSHLASPLSSLSLSLSLSLSWTPVESQNEFGLPVGTPAHAFISTLVYDIGNTTHFFVVVFFFFLFLLFLDSARSPLFTVGFGSHNF
jgi:hypothetical protein